jgi:alpha-beta hydrolase superfamily lysophospholipase
MIEQPLPAFGISVATCLGHYIRMGKGAPAKLLVDHLDALLAGGTIDLYGYPCGLEYFKDFISGAPIYRLAMLTRPVLFLQGAADNVFRRTDARLGYEMMRAHWLQAGYREIAEGDHGLGNKPHEATTAVLDWLHMKGLLPQGV